MTIINKTIYNFQIIIRRFNNKISHFNIIFLIIMILNLTFILVLLLDPLRLPLLQLIKITG